MHYKVIYKTKSQKENTTVSIYHEEEIISITKQLQRGVTSIKGKLINGLDDLEHIEVIKCNYDYINENGIHIEEKTISDNGEFHEIPYFSLKLNPSFIPEEINVTSKLFYDANIGHLGDNIFNYKNGIITIYGEAYPLNKKTKYWEMFDLILETYNDLEEITFKYDKLDKIFNEIKYKELTEKDLLYGKMRDTLKNKLKEIREYFEMEKDIITLGVDSITINNI